MKLCRGPRACAIGTHILLAQIGRPRETEAFGVIGGDTREPPFSDVNPEGKVPTRVRADVAGTLHGRASGCIFTPAQSEPPDMVHGTPLCAERASFTTGEALRVESGSVMTMGG